MEEQRHVRRHIRSDIDEPGLRASIAADLNLVVSSGNGAAPSQQHVRIRQVRSNRTAPAPDQKEQP